MPKSTIDWEAAERLSLGVDQEPPIVALATELDEEVRRLKGIVIECDSARRKPKLPNVLVSMNKRTHPESSYVRAYGMIAIFSEFDVLEGYYSGQEEDGAQFVDMTDGWRLVLRRPDNRGLFQVTYTQADPPYMYNQKATYLATA